MSHYLSSRIAARATARQIDAVLLSDRAANAADRAIIAQWRRLMVAIAQQSPARAQQHAHTALAGLLPVARQSIAHSLDRMTRWGHRAALTTLDVLPTKYLRTAALQRIAPVQESLLEADVLGWPGVPNIGGSAIKPGIIELVLRALGLASDPFSETQLQFGPREEPTEDQLSPAQQRQALAGFLFPPPSQEQVNRIVYAPVAGMTWEKRLEAATRTSATPQQLAQIVGEGVAQGKMASQIARALLPVVDGVRSTARRIARSESMRVYNEANHEAHQGLGDMIQGYILHATLDENTRPAHAARNGQMFFVNPKPGQKGLDEMPHPPMEADGSMAWNCRCWLSVFLYPADYIENEPALSAVFKNAESEIAPDPLEYSNWFNQTDERRRSLAVGPRRYLAIKEKLGANPPWSAFIDPESGSLLSLQTLKREPAETRVKRMANVSEAVAKRGEMLKRVLTFGSI